MSKEFLFLSGRISALESKLLSFSQIERMVMAKTPEDAFRILVELQYSDIFDDSTKPQDFLNIIYQGLIETKKMIMDGTDNDPAFEFIWKNFDLNNLKRALKIKLLEKKIEIEDFSEDNGFNWLGSLSKEDIQLIVFANGKSDKIPQEYSVILDKTEKVFSKNNNFQEVELMLDKAHFDFLNNISNRKGVKFLKVWLEKMADMTNIKTVARNLFLFETEFTKEMFLSYGKIPFSELQEVNSIESLNKIFVNNEMISLEESVTTESTNEENILSLEKEVSKYMDKFLQTSESDSLGGIEIPLVYLHKRIKNARKIKFIMLSKFYGIEPEKIYETLKNI